MAADFAALFSLSNLFTLLMLILLQAVLGFDNLLYISIESKRVPPEKQSYVRRLGIGLAIALRLVLLFVLLQAVKHLQGSLFKLKIGSAVYGDFSPHSLIVLFGGGFIIYTAIKEIYHLLAVDDLSHGEDEKPRTTQSAIFWIVLMNLIFSFDSILSAMALTKNFWVMAIAVVLSGLMMIWLADTVSNFLQKHRMYEVLGLFVLFIVGIMLVSEGGHLAHLKFFSYPVEPMSKTTFYFVLFVLVVVDVIQGQYQKKLMAQKAAKLQQAATISTAQKAAKPVSTKALPKTEVNEGKGSSSAGSKGTSTGTGSKKAKKKKKKKKKR